MLRLLSDENFNGDIVRGLLARLAGLDLVRVQDTVSRTPGNLMPVGQALDELELLITCSLADEFRDRVEYVPL